MLKGVWGWISSQLARLRLENAVTGGVGFLMAWGVTRILDAGVEDATARDIGVVAVVLISIIGFWAMAILGSRQAKSSEAGRSDQERRKESHERAERVPAAAPSRNKPEPTGETAPVLRLDLSVVNAEQPSKPNENRYADPLLDDELDWRRDGDEDKVELLFLTVENLQRHASGSAVDVHLQVTLFLPVEEFPFDFPLGHLQPGVKEFHVLVSLAGLKWSRVLISEIEFYDSEGNQYSRAHGLAYLERAKDGTVEPAYLTIEHREEGDESET